MEVREAAQVRGPQSRCELELLLRPEAGWAGRELSKAMPPRSLREG